MHNCRECKFKSVAARCLTDSELDSLDNDSVEVRFRKGDLIFKQDALSLNITYLRTGLVKVHMKGPNSEKIMRITNWLATTENFVEQAPLRRDRGDCHAHR